MGTESYGAASVVALFIAMSLGMFHANSAQAQVTDDQFVIEDVITEASDGSVTAEDDAVTAGFLCTLMSPHFSALPK